jgi:hypothetical protein
MHHDLGATERPDARPPLYRASALYAHRFGGLSGSSTEQCFEFLPQHLVNVRHGSRNAEIGETGNPIALSAHAAGHDAGEMRQIRLDIERPAVQRHPTRHADTDGAIIAVATLDRPQDTSE